MNNLSRITEVYIFIDGPRNEHDCSLIGETIEIASQDYSFGTKHLFIQKENLGLANSIRNGIDKVLSGHSRIIVVEDDLVVSNYFLDFLNQGLLKYVDNENISSINGYQYPLGDIGSDPVFLLGADCWGWGTWKNRWNSVSFDSSDLYERLSSRGLIRKFDLDNSMPYSKMLLHQAKGEIDSWAICWHASMYLQGRVAVSPAESLVLNEGTDGSGSHNEDSEIFKTHLSLESSWVFPDVISESSAYRILLSMYLLKARRSSSLLFRGKSRLLRIMRLSWIKRKFLQ
jgi:hypothetical protein